MSQDTQDTLANRTVVAAGAAIGSAAIAAALLFVKRRRDKVRDARALPAPDTTPTAATPAQGVAMKQFPAETD